MLLIGILVGFAVGILPGFGSTVALALMLPFTFKMEPVSAFAFLLGMLAVTETTGDITSVLFGIPGESSTAATVLDGYPMTKRGEAGRALGAALMSSLVGAVLGAVFLFAALPIVQPLVLSFGAPEFFMFSLVGIALVGSLSSGAVRRGLIVGGLGLTLAFIGLSVRTGAPRLTFGWIYLLDGLNLVPVVVGLFAVPEIIELGVKGTSIAERNAGKLGGVMEGIKDTFRYWAITVRCSFLSSFLGMIPGISTVAQWVAYAHAVQSAKDKSMFGKGDVRGVLGPGAANNSKLGGNLITTVAFGIPGSVTTALLLSALQVQGLVPGPDMLTKSLYIPLSMVWSIMMANILTVSMCFLFLTHLVKITHVRASLLIPSLVLFTFIGTYTTSNNYIDLITMLVFGALGSGMVALKWPRPPLVLGLVLGSFAETYFYLSVARYEFTWLTRPIVLFLMAVIGLSIFLPSIRTWMARASRVPAEVEIADELVEAFEEPNTRVDAAATPRWWKYGEIAFALFIAGFLTFMFVNSLDLSVRAGQFVWVVIVPTAVLALWELIQSVRGKNNVAVTYEHPEGGWGVFWRRATQLSAWYIGFLLAVWWFGFAIGGALVAIAFLRTTGRESWKWSVLYGLGTYAFVEGIMVRLLQVPLPSGSVVDWITALFG
jgi:TctA family transporter